MVKMYESNHYLSSISRIQDKLKQEDGLDIKRHRLAHILRHHCNMRYRKIKEVSWQSNSARNLILRQRFGLAFLKLDLENMTVINVDETWVGQTDFRRRKWTFLKRPDSVPKKNVQPRLSMIAALDTNGGVHISLLQSNTNSNIMEMYMAQLLERLD